MSGENAIKVESLSRKYFLQHAVKDKTGNTTHDIWALKNVSFEISKGESVGIIGPNGSGKSTLLKIMAGVTKPTSGSVEIRGRVASILDIGAGFHPDLSGRENVFLNGQILGFSKYEIEDKFDEIVAFSGIEKFIDEPVKNYSNGMYLRLAFSIIAHLNFDVYLLDEVLSVGDVEFRTKCFEKIADLISDRNKTILLISHNLQEISKTCGKVILMKEGSIIKLSSIDEALFGYLNSGEKRIPKIPSFVKQAKVEFTDKNGNAKQDFINSEAVVVCISNSFNEAPENVKIAIRVSDKLNNVVFNTSPVLTKTNKAEIDFKEKNSFLAEIPGYMFNSGFFAVDLVYFDNEKILDEIKNINFFTVRLDAAFAGKNLTGESGPIKPYLDWIVK